MRKQRRPAQELLITEMKHIDLFDCARSEKLVWGSFHCIRGGESIISRLVLVFMFLRND